MHAGRLIRSPDLTRLTWSHVDRMFDRANDSSAWAVHEHYVRMIAEALCRQEHPGMDLDVDFRRVGERRPARPVSCELREDYLRQARKMIRGIEPPPEAW